MATYITLSANDHPKVKCIAYRVANLCLQALIVFALRKCSASGTV